MGGHHLPRAGPAHAEDEAGVPACSPMRMRARQPRAPPCLGGGPARLAPARRSSLPCAARHAAGRRSALHAHRPCGDACGSGCAPFHLSLHTASLRCAPGRRRSGRALAWNGRGGHRRTAAALCAQVLHPCSGAALPGECLALLGPSGAGVPRGCFAFGAGRV